MKLDIKFYIILALLLALVISILTRPTKEITDLTPYRTQIAIDQLTIDSLSKGRAKLARRISEDSILRHEERIAHKEDVKKKNATIAKLKANPTVIMVRDSIPVVDSLIIAQDLLIESQAIRIVVLEGDVKTLGIDLAQVTDNFEATLAAMQSKIQATEQLADAYKKENRKERRKRKIATALIPVAGVGLFLLGSQL